MINKKYSLFFVLSLSLFGNIDYKIEDNNIFYMAGSQNIDYNLLRANLSYYYVPDERFSAHLIVDNKNFYYSKNEENNENTTKVYRGYLEYIGEKHLLSIGRQRVPLGIGTIWSPLDIFNPKDPYSTTTKEVEGIDSIKYEYAINPVSDFRILAAEDKFALRGKFKNLGIDYIDDEDFKILGYEFQSEIFETGVDFKSEGGNFNDKKTDKTHSQYMVGVEAGFENSLNLNTEYKYDTSTDIGYAGIIGNYQLTPLLILEVLLIKNLEDKSYLLNFGGNYSLSDESTLRVAVVNYEGKQQSEFSYYEDSLLIDFFIQF